MKKYYEILDDNNRIASCNLQEIPEEERKLILKQGGELDKLTFYYDMAHDFVILNKNHANYEFYKDIVMELLNYSEADIFRIYEQLAKDARRSLRRLLMLLGKIKRYRELKGVSYEHERVY